jgi:putative hemolysin
MPVVEIVIILALIVLNGFFAMAELAVVSARPIRLHALARAGNPAATRVLELSADPNRFLSAVQLGITLISIMTGAFGGATVASWLAGILEGFPALAPYAHSLGVGIVVVVLTFLSVMFGELLPKRIALAAPERIAMRVARPLALFAALGRPVVLLLGAISDAVLRLIGVRTSGEDAVTEEEVRVAIAEGTAAGAIDPAEREMMEGVLRLADRPVRAIMVPRRDVVWIDLDDDPAAIREELRNCTYSRVVVTRDGAIDEPLGVVQKKELLAQLLDDKPLDLTGSIREPLYAPEGISVLRLLDLFKKTPAHVAFVVDEFGGFEGLVTPTDVLEAIAGDLAPETGEKPDIIARGDGSYLVEGSTSLDDLAHDLQVTAPPEADFHTVAGLVLAELGRIPAEGERLRLGGWSVEIVDMDGPRIDKLLFTPAPEQDAAAGLSE